MAISTAAALIGAAVIGGGASYLSSKSASKTAANAANYAADQNAAVNREIYNQTRSDLAPYNQAGQGGLAALMTRLGLTPMQAGAAGQPQVQPAAAPVGNGAAAAKATGGPAGTSPMEPGAMTYQTTGFGGQKAPAGYYFGPSDELLPIPGGQAGATPAPSGQPAPQAAPQTPQAAPAMTGGQPDFAAYGAANPDVAAEWQRIVSTGNAGNDKFQNDPNKYYAWHYQTYGQNEGRDLPTSGGTQAPAAPQAPVDPNAPPPEYYQETYAQRPDAMAPPEYQRAPDMQAPGAFSYTPQDIENDLGYQFARDESLKGVNANFAARGRLRSGGAAKELQDRAAGVAHQWDSDYFNRALSTYNTNTDAYRYGQDRGDRNFVDDRSYGTNLWNTQQNRADNIFSEDRGFAAGRNDQATSNLFNLVGVGQGAAAGTANAGNVFANNAIANNNNRANTTANAAIANAQNTSNLFGSAANAVGTYYGMRGRI